MKRLLLLLLLAGFGGLKAQNTPPVITAIAQNASFGEQSCINISTTDADGDSVFIGWNKAVYGSLVSNNHQAKYAQGQVCITASRNIHAIGNNPFVVFATDGKDTVFKTCSFIIHDYPYKVHPVIQHTATNTFFVDVMGDNTEPWGNYEGLTFESKIYDASNTLVHTDANRKFTFIAPTPGKYRVYTTYRTARPDAYTSVDTMDTNAPLSAKTPNAVQLHLYPNPAVSYISVDGLQGLPATVEVVDVTGKTLLTTRFNAQTQAIDVSGLPTGVYVVAVKGDGNNFFAVSKFVKQ
jgi:hypothetical protein